jgi:hypothetical protein
LLILRNVCNFLIRGEAVCVIDCRVRKHDFRHVTCLVVRCLLGMSFRDVQVLTSGDLLYLGFVLQIIDGVICLYIWGKP